MADRALMGGLICTYRPTSGRPPPLCGRVLAVIRTAQTEVTIFMVEEDMRLARKIAGEGCALQVGGTVLHGFDQPEIRDVYIAGAAV